MTTEKEQDAQVIVEEEVPQVIVEDVIEEVEAEVVEKETTVETETTTEEIETTNPVISAEEEAPTVEDDSIVEDGATDNQPEEASEEEVEEVTSDDVVVDEVQEEEEAIDECEVESNEAPEAQEVIEEVEEEEEVEQVIVEEPVVNTDTEFALVEVDGELKEVPVDMVDKLPAEKPTEEPTEEPVEEKPMVEETPTKVEPLMDPSESKLNNKPTYPRNPELESVMAATCKTMKQLDHVTNVRAKSKNNRHWTLTIESNMIQNLFLHGVNMSFFDKKNLLEALQLILNHWNDNLGILPDNCFMVCYMRLLLDKHTNECEPKASSMLSQPDIRKKIIAHYMSSKYEWTWRSILPALKFADVCEAKSRWIDSTFKTRVRNGQQWTPYLEEMESYFHIDSDPFADITVPDDRMKEVGVTLRTLQIRNPRIVGHIVKINAMRKCMLEERAEKIEKGTIDLTHEVINIKEAVDPLDLRASMMSGE